MEILHALLDALRNCILISGLVVIMMMMIESFNIESHGIFFKGLRRSRFGQVIIGATLGSIPGCMGGFAVVSLYTHRMISLGALVAMMIASSGDEAFVMLAMFPDKALWIMLILFFIGIATGLLTDYIHDKRHSKHCHKEEHSECGEAMKCGNGFEIHDSCDEHEHKSESAKHSEKKRHFGLIRLSMFVGVAIFIGALAGGMLGHEHHHETAVTAECVHEHNSHDCTEHTAECHHHTAGCHNHAAHEHSGHAHHSEGINLLSEDWMNVLFAVLSVVILIVLLFASDHFVEEHLWKHIVCRHLPRIFLWTLAVLSAINVCMLYFDITDWISSHSGITLLMIIIAALLGIIPESGPHLVFVSVFALYIASPELEWTSFLPVLLASSISQDGHASIPLLAESKTAFFRTKAINCVAGIVVGLLSWVIILFI